MAFIRRYTDLPGVEILTNIEAIDIIDKTGPSAIAGLNQGTVLLVGEFLKGEPNKPQLITSPKQIEDYFGTVSSESNPGGDVLQQSITSLGTGAPAAYCGKTEGNGYFAISAATFGSLVLMNVDQSVGSVTLTQSTADTSVVLKAGALIKIVESSAINWFAILQDVSFAAGKTVAGVKIRRVAGVTTSFSAAGVMYKDSNVSVAVENSGAVVDLTTTTLDAKYVAAIDTFLADTAPVNNVSMFVTARHTDTIIKELVKNATSLTGSGRGRLCVVAPPVGTSRTVVEGSSSEAMSAVALGHAGYNHGANVVYTWPAIIKPVKELAALGYDPNVTVSGDADLAGVISQTAPEENPAQATDLLNYIIGIEKAQLPYLTLAQYIQFRSPGPGGAGIMAPRYDKATGMGYQSGVTTVDPTVYPEYRNIARMRMAFFIEDSVANALQPFSKAIMSDRNKNAVTGEVIAFLDSLYKDERVGGYNVDPDSGNTPEKEAQGIYTIIMSVRTLASMDAIVLYSEIGETVVLKEG